MDAARVIAQYGAAWQEPDSGRRASLLDAVWAEDGVYCDPSAEITGRRALVDHIGGFHRARPGARIELTSAPSVHHDQVYFTWRMVSAEGAVELTGVDFGMLDGDGRLARIVGFFGDPPAL